MTHPHFRSKAICFLYGLSSASGVNRSKSKLRVQGLLYAFFPPWTRLWGPNPAHEESPFALPLLSFSDVFGEDMMLGATAAILQL